jgi:alpha-L-fucosidase
MDRVAEIHAHILASKRGDGIIYLADVGGEVVCYESNHRREALKGVPDDIAPVLVDLLWNATDEIVKQEFMRLNKAVSVPELYVTEEAVVNADELRVAVKDFCKKYASLKVTSGRPQRPSFNESIITDEFLKVTRDNKISVAEMLVRLDRVNVHLAAKDKKKLSEKIIEKCEKSGLWLFAYDTHLNSKDFA